MNYCNFGENLKSLRKISNLTQQELGVKLGLSKAVISKYENGLGYPTFDMLVRIAHYFDVSTDYLLGVKKSMSVNLSGLSAEQIEIIQKLIHEFRSKDKTDP